MASAAASGSAGSGKWLAGWARRDAAGRRASATPGTSSRRSRWARALARRGHEVTIETWEERRDAVEGAGLGFAAAEEYRMFPPPTPTPRRAPTPPRRRGRCCRCSRSCGPHAVVSDILTLAPALAAEKAGVPLATLIPHIYPVVEPGLPFFAIGLRPPRTPLGRGDLAGGTRALNVGLEQGRRDLNSQRERLGLPPLDRFHGGISPDLALVATYPQLEYPRPGRPGGRDHRADDLRAAPSRDRAAARATSRWSSSPPAPPTTRDNHLVRTALAALADEPVRVVATTNRAGPQSPIEVPANAILVDWLSYSQLMPAASLVVSHGGHGTVARALGAGTPVLSARSSAT